MHPQRSILLIENEEGPLSDFESDLAELTESRFFTAANNEEALYFIGDNASPMDVIVIDMDTVHENGIDLIKKFHNRNKSSNIIAIASENEPPSLRTQIFSAGGVGYIEKPLDFEDFASMIQQELSPQGFNGVGVHGMNLLDLIQFIEMDNRSILLKVRNKRAEEGRLYFDKGALVHATTQEKVGKEACYEVMAWEGGWISSLQLPTEFPTTIFDSTTFLILEAMRIKDEQENDLTLLSENSTAHPPPHTTKEVPADTSVRPEKTAADSAFTGTSVPSPITTSKEIIMALQQIQEQFKSEIQGFISGVVVDTEQSLLLAGTSADSSLDMTVPVGFFNEVVRTTNSALDVTSWGMPEDILISGKDYNIVIFILKDGAYWQGLSISKATPVGMALARFRAVKDKLIAELP